MSLTDDQKAAARKALGGLLQMVGQEMMFDSKDWFGADVATDIDIITLGIAGEAGEVCDVLKKMHRGTLSDEEGWPKYCEELVDVFIYVISACALLNFNIVEGYYEKRAFNNERFSQHASSPDQSTLAAAVRGQQPDPLGASAFVGEGQLPEALQ